MPSPFIIFYVDDDKDDCILLESSLKDAGISANFIVASDGEEAANLLNTLSINALPSLIVLDLNMPRWDGHRTLRYLKSEPRLASIPVAIFSTSDNKKEREACEELGAAGYFNKPFHYEGYKTIISGLMKLLQPPTKSLSVID